MDSPSSPHHLTWSMVKPLLSRCPLRASLSRQQLWSRFVCDVLLVAERVRASYLAEFSIPTSSHKRLAEWVVQWNHSVPLRCRLIILLADGFVFFASPDAVAELMRGAALAASAGLSSGGDEEEEEQEDEHRCLLVVADAETPSRILGDERLKLMLRKLVGALPPISHLRAAGGSAATVLVELTIDGAFIVTLAGWLLGYGATYCFLEEGMNGDSNLSLVPLSLFKVTIPLLQPECLLQVKSCGSESDSPTSSSFQFSLPASLRSRFSLSSFQQDLTRRVSQSGLFSARALSLAETEVVRPHVIL
eukprot:TRINITY_DN4317_c0_g1_i1.p1 TRINITY_DN4317_c0_g1~~TRINITY_DN4317_c0_g1_i1.p1  ORF type:complete len:315 (+),score=42.10 TRINITY_DN4317_c0_g1_i1:31-945(+)